MNVAAVNETNDKYLFNFQITGKTKDANLQELRAANNYEISNEAKAQSNYMAVFMRMYIEPSAGTHEEQLENTARKYSELRDEILDQYIDDEDEMYRRLDVLNQAFETALKNTCLMPIYSTKINSEIRISYTEEERIRNEAELTKIAEENERYNKNVNDVRQNFQNNMLRHVNTFYESFIRSIQTNDFDTAFTESMALLENNETKSYEEISYNDMLIIREVISNEATKFDEDGRPVEYKYKTSEDSFRALVKDTNIPYIVRKDVAERFGFYII